MNDIVLKNLLHNKQYTGKVLPFLKPQYFDNPAEKNAFKLIKSYIVKYRKMPVVSELKEGLKNLKTNEHTFNETFELLDTLGDSAIQEGYEWLVNETERWVRNQAFICEVLASSDAISKQDQGKMNQMPDRMQKALSICFDNEIGIEFLDDEDIDGRWKKYHKKVAKFPTLIETLDRYFAGGLETKSLSCILAGTNVGKTMAMISLACSFIRQGYDVLYVTLEMSEEKIAMRADANFLEIPINDIKNIPEAQYIESMKGLDGSDEFGRLIIKEYAPTTINVTHLRSLLDELEIKKEFRPQILIVDYLNLLNSARYTGDNMYSMVKATAEELRGLCIDKDLCGLTATQGNRETNSSTTSDMDLTNTSESIGLPQTVDAMWAMIFPEDMRNRNIQLWKILKNRFGDIINVRFPIRVNFPFCQFTDGNDVELQLNDSQSRRKAKEPDEVVQKAAKDIKDVLFKDEDQTNPFNEEEDDVQ